MPDRTFPHLERYLSDLPDGLASHPGCRVRASTLHAALDSLSLSEKKAEGLPEPLRHLALHPPPRLSYVPEVHNLAIYSWLRDARFTDDRSFLRFLDAVFERFYATPSYRVSFLLAPAESVASATPRRWSWMRKGSTITVAERSDAHVRLRLSYPERLFDRLHVEGLAHGLRLAYEHNDGVNDVTMEVLRHGATETLFEVRWRPE